MIYVRSRINEFIYYFNTKWKHRWIQREKRTEARSKLFFIHFRISTCSKITYIWIWMWVNAFIQSHHQTDVVVVVVAVIVISNIGCVSVVSGMGHSKIKKNTKASTTTTTTMEHYKEIIVAQILCTLSKNIFLYISMRVCHCTHKFRLYSLIEYFIHTLSRSASTIFYFHSYKYIYINIPLLLLLLLLILPIFFHPFILSLNATVLLFVVPNSSYFLYAFVLFLLLHHRGFFSFACWLPLLFRMLLVVVTPFLGVSFSIYLSWFAYS